MWACSDCNRILHCFQNDFREGVQKHHYDFISHNILKSEEPVRYIFKLLQHVCELAFLANRARNHVNCHGSQLLHTPRFDTRKLDALLRTRKHDGEQQVYAQQIRSRSPHVRKLGAGRERISAARGGEPRGPEVLVQRQLRTHALEEQQRDARAGASRRGARYAARGALAWRGMTARHEQLDLSVGLRGEREAQRQAHAVYRRCKFAGVTLLH